MSDGMSDMAQASAYLEEFWTLADELRDRYGIPISQTCDMATRGLM